MPFEIPENWEWCRISTISSIVTKGTTPRGGNVSYQDQGIGFLRAEYVAGLDMNALKRPSKSDFVLLYSLSDLALDSSAALDALKILLDQTPNVYILNIHPCIPANEYWVSLYYYDIIKYWLAMSNKNEGCFV